MMASQRIKELEAKEGRLFTLYEVAEYAKFSINTVRNHMVKGALVTIKIGGARRVREEDLKIYLRGTPGEDSLK